MAADSVFPWSETLRPGVGDRYRIFGGHYGVRDAEEKLGHPAFFTILRRPDSRLCSLYRFWSQDPGRHVPVDLRHLFEDKDFNFESFIAASDPRMLRHIDNAMVTILSGKYHQPDDSFRSEQFPGADPSDLDVALKRIDGFASIFFLEDRKLSTSFAEAFGVANIRFPQVNASDSEQRPDQALVDSLSPAGRERLSELTKFDQTLYDAAQEKMDARPSKRAIDLALQFPALVFTPTVRRGQEVLFGSANANAEMMLIAGWNEIEQSLVWTQAGDAQLRFKIVGEGPRGLRFVIEPYLTPNHAAQVVSLTTKTRDSLNAPLVDVAEAGVVAVLSGHRLALSSSAALATELRNTYFWSVPNGGQVTVDLWFSQPMRESVVDVIFRIAMPVRPLDADGVADSRLLGVALKSMLAL
ncbi:MAG TPA: hypothetical protein VGH40_03630 [Roseiarcus sp.]|jgi:hypothetical protein